MNDQLNEILRRLRDGKIDVDATIKEIESVRHKDDIEISPKKRARKLKIYINAIDDKKDGKNIRINLPALPLRFIKRLSVFGLKIAIKHSDKKDTVIDLAEIEKVKYLFDALMLLPPFEIINVDSKDAKVHIYTC